MSQTPNKSKSTNQDGRSVADAMFLPAPPLDDILMAQEPIQVKCNTCDTVTEQGWVQIDVQPLVTVGPEIAEAMMKLRKRLVFCTHCGTYRVTN